MDGAQSFGAVLMAIGILGVGVGVELVRDRWTEAALSASIGEPQPIETQVAGLTSALLMVLGVTSGVVGGFLLRPVQRP